MGTEQDGEVELTGTRSELERVYREQGARLWHALLALTWTFWFVRYRDVVVRVRIV